MNSSLLLIGNFLSGSGGSRGVCEELAVRLSDCGTRVITASDKPARLLRICDMLMTTYRERQHYQVAHVDVYSGAAFIWAEAVCALLKHLEKRFVLTLHGGNLPQFAGRHPRRVRRLLASAEIVTTPSRFMLEKMREYRADLRLLPNAIEIDRYPFRLRENPAPTLVWLRAFHEIYNPSLAPRVAHLLAKQFPDAQFTMIGPDKGDGSLRRTLAVASELGVSKKLSIPGAVAKREVPMRLAGADVFLNTTNVDNSPVSVLEAMACGLCVVSTDAGGLPHLLQTGQNALLVPTNNAEEMARAVRRILLEPELARRISQNARSKAEEHDWSVVLPQWKELFGTLARDGCLEKRANGMKTVSRSRSVELVDRAP